MSDIDNGTNWRRATMQGPPDRTCYVRGVWVHVCLHAQRAADVIIPGDIFVLDFGNDEAMHCKCKTAEIDRGGTLLIRVDPTFDTATMEF